MENNFRSGFAAVIGRPSTGKSTLINKLCGHKVSIVCSIPQTTRNVVRGIVTREKGQIVFLDTPGYHISEKKINNYLKDVTESVIPDSDLVLYLVDSTRETGEEELITMKLIQDSGLPYVIILTKCDIASKLRAGIKSELETATGKKIVEISSVTGEGLDEMMEAILEAAPEGEMMYPEEYYTDQDPEFRVSEIIREKAINLMREEIPHSLYIEVEDMEERENDLLWIRAFVVVERESQKGMVIGKKASIIKQIRLTAKQELKEIFERPVFLDLNVKVNKKWRHDDRLLRRLTKSYE
ncbi:MAG: GTPase Era [Spirochaetales bacterium]|nr:GTPase Era [Spirochaetales bacterium]